MNTRRRHPIVPGCRVADMSEPPREGVVLATDGLVATVQWDEGHPPENILFGYLQAMPSGEKLSA